MSPLPMTERALAVALERVGVRERGANRGFWVERFLSAVGLGPGYAWCAAFVYWCLLRAGARSDRLPARRRAAGVAEWVRWAEAHGRLRSEPARGRLFYWLQADGRGHLGFVLGPAWAGAWRTVEGNTSPAGSREGDGVYERVRVLENLRRHDRWGFIDLEGLA